MDISAKLSGAYKSWVIWFNGLLGSLAVAVPAISDALPQLRHYIPDNTYSAITALLVVGNLILRFKTDKPLEDK